jgi:hypothetical protein
MDPNLASSLNIFAGLHQHIPYFLLVSSVDMTKFLFVPKSFMCLEMGGGGVSSMRGGIVLAERASRLLHCTLVLVLQHSNCVQVRIFVIYLHYESFITFLQYISVMQDIHETYVKSEFCAIIS